MPVSAEVQEQDSHEGAKQKIFEAFLNKGLEDEHEDNNLNYPKHPV